MLVTLNFSQIWWFKAFFFKWDWGNNTRCKQVQNPNYSNMDDAGDGEVYVWLNAKGKLFRAACLTVIGVIILHCFSQNYWATTLWWDIDGCYMLFFVAKVLCQWLAVSMCSLSAPIKGNCPQLHCSLCCLGAAFQAIPWWQCHMLVLAWFPYSHIAHQCCFILCWCCVRTGSDSESAGSCHMPQPISAMHQISKFIYKFFMSLKIRDW